MGRRATSVAVRLLRVAPGPLLTDDQATTVVTAATVPCDLKGSRSAVNKLGIELKSARFGAAPRQP